MRPQSTAAAPARSPLHTTRPSARHPGGQRAQPARRIRRTAPPTPVRAARSGNGAARKPPPNPPPSPPRPGREPPWPHARLCARRLPLGRRVPNRGAAGVPRPQGRPTQRSLCEHFRVLGRALAAAAIAKCDATVTAPAWRRPHTASAEAALCQAAPPPPHRLGARRHRPRCWVLLARPRSRFGPATLSPPAADAAAAPDAPLAARQRSHRRCSRRPPARPRTHGADIDASGSDANPLQGATP